MNVIWADKNATGPLKLVSRFEYRHPRVFAGVRTVSGVWLLILGVFRLIQAIGATGDRIGLLVVGLLAILIAILLLHNTTLAEIALGRPQYHEDLKRVLSLWARARSARSSRTGRSPVG